MSDAVMWSIGQIAERDGVSKPAVSKAVRAMLDAKPDTPHELDGRGRVRLVSLADYDHYRGRHVNPAKAKAEIRREVAGVAAPSLDLVEPLDSFDEARRQNEWIKVRRQRLEHAETVKQLVRRDREVEALTQAGREVQALLGRLPNRADDVALAVSKEGVHGVRVLLREIAFQLGTAIADRFAEIAGASPELDEEYEENVL